MHCRNCGNEVNDKAVACPKCGMNPRTEKNFCPGCGAETKPNQVMCTNSNCGVSLASTSALSLDMSSLQNIDIKALLKDKTTLIFPAIAFLGFFFTWVKYTSDVFVKQTMNFSGSSLADFLKQFPQVDTILAPMLLYLFPLCLVGMVAADFVPQIMKYKKIFSIAALLLVVYAAIGIFTMKIDMPEMSAMQQSLVGKMDVSFSAGFGLYLSLAATIASVIFSKKQTA